MNAKEYLLEISKIDRLIKNKNAEKEYWQQRSEATSTVVEGDRVQSSGDKDKMGTAVSIYVTIENEIAEEINRLAAKRREIISTIEQLKTNEYDVLHKVYVQYKEFQEVSVEMEKSYSWVTTVHGRALANLQKILDEKGV